MAMVMVKSILVINTFLMAFAVTKVQSQHGPMLMAMAKLMSSVMMIEEIIGLEQWILDV